MIPSVGSNQTAAGRTLPFVIHMPHIHIIPPGIGIVQLRSVGGCCSSGLWFGKLPGVGLCDGMSWSKDFGFLLLQGGPTSTSRTVVPPVIFAVFGRGVGGREIGVVEGDGGGGVWLAMSGRRLD